MSDPRNVAHAKKVTQEKKHQGTEVKPEDAHAAETGKKAASKKHDGGTAAPAAVDAGIEAEAPAPRPSAILDSSLVVLGKFKEMEFYSRASLEKLAELVLTVGDELKQKNVTAPLDEVYSAQNALQTKLTALIDVYKDECDRLHAETV
jgi:hypothetical protein